MNPGFRILALLFFVFATSSGIGAERKKNELGGAKAVCRISFRSDWNLLIYPKSENVFAVEWGKKGGREYSEMRVFCVKSDFETVAKEAGLERMGGRWLYFSERGHVAAEAIDRDQWAGIARTYLLGDVCRSVVGHLKGSQVSFGWEICVPEASSSMFEVFKKIERRVAVE